MRGSYNIFGRTRESFFSCCLFLFFFWGGALYRCMHGDYYAFLSPADLISK